MTSLGLPVPPGLHHHHRGLPGLPRGRARARRARRRGRPSTSPRSRRRWAAGSATPSDPLLVSVRSGAKFSMPGMMETVLNVGLNDESVDGLAAAERGRAVRVGLLPPAGADVRRDRARHRRRRFARRARRGQGRQAASTADLDLDAEDLRGAGRDVQGADRASTPAATSRRTRASSCDLAVRAVFDSWNTERAVLYRRQERIPDDLGTAVNVQAMVFGNRGIDSGSGVASPATRRPARQGVYGDYLPERPGRGRRGRHPQHRAAGRPGGDRHRGRTPSCCEIMATLERHYRDMCDIEFTIEQRQALDAADPGRQAHPRGGVPDRVRPGRRGPHRPGRGAAPGHRRPARPADVPALRRRRAPRDLLATGHERLARRRRRQGRLRLRDRGRVGRARARTSSWSAGRPTPTTCTAWWRPRGILTSRGGKTSHAAVVARGMGRTCVCGAEALDVDAEAQAVHRTRRHGGPRGRRHLHRRHDRRGLPRRGAGRRLRWWCATSRATDAVEDDLRRRRSPGCMDARRRRAAGCRCAPTPTPPTTPPAPAGSAPRASACAAPSTCSSASGASSSST